MAIPRSWEVGANVRTLKEVLNQPTNAVVNSVAPGLIPFNEVGADILPRDMRLSSNVNSAAIMTFATDANVFKDPALRRVFGIGVLGGYDPTTNTKYTPLQHPYSPGQFAKDIVKVDFMSPVAPTNEGGTRDKTYASSVALVTISFETLPYWVGVPTPTDADYNMNYVNWRVKATNMKVTNPLGLYVFDGTSVPAQFGIFKNMPTQWIELVIYQVPSKALWGTTPAATIPRPLVASGGDFLGLVNNVEFAGVPAQKLLLDSFETSEVYHHWLGYELYNVKYNLIYNDWGWNKQPYPFTNEVQFIGSIFNSAVRPFSQANFKSFFQNRNPIPNPAPPGPPVPFAAGF